jgi:hypothetical protein
VDKNTGEKHSASIFMVEVSSVRKRLDYTDMLTCTVVDENLLGGVVKNITTKNPNTSSTQPETVSLRKK